MKKGLTEVVCILDRSGSMGSIISDAIGGVNTLLADQRKAKEERKISVVLFDDRYELLYDRLSPNAIPDFTEATYAPRGMTAMNDAIGKTIDSFGARLANTHESERPEKVIFAILTDGQENSSREYTSVMVKEKIEHQTNKYNWVFMFLAAGQDAVVTGQNIGISSGNSVSFSGSGIGTRSAYALFSKTINKVSEADYDMRLASMSLSAANNGSNTLEDKQ